MQPRAEQAHDERERLQRNRDIGQDGAPEIKQDRHDRPDCLQHRLERLACGDKEVLKLLRCGDGPDARIEVRHQVDHAPQVLFGQRFERLAKRRQTSREFRVQRG